MDDKKLKIIRIIGLSVLAFIIMFGYSVFRPASESLFLKAHTSKALPSVWLILAISMIGFEFNYFVEKFYPKTDIRTDFIGNVYAVSSFLNFIFHSLTGLILRLSGVPMLLLLIPVLLGAGLSTFIIMPTIIMISIVKVAGKTFDYTIFRASKEMLYIPLSYKEKTSGKSVVDMMTSRVAKGFASAFLLVLMTIKIGLIIPIVTLILITVWISLTIIITRRFRSRVSREQEMKASSYS